jgi:hypothetical protein
VGSDGVGAANNWRASSSLRMGGCAPHRVPHVVAVTTLVRRIARNVSQLSIH